MSVATTWRLSFEQVQHTNVNAAQLLRLLSFLNPDVILTDFLEAGKQIITIYRLVQSVIKDEMTETEYSFFIAQMISLCDHAFPLYITNTDSRRRYRRYQAQVAIPLSGIPTTRSNVQLEVMERIAWFLHDDGKYVQSRELQ